MIARLLFLASLVVSTALPAAPQLPNIVIIFTDDQGYADVGVFGAKGFKTPNLDRLAKDGCKFTNFHVAQPVCSASRAALLTGCYPNRIGIHGALGPQAKHGINDNEMTLAELLKQKGYATGMAGKWHLGRPAQFLPVHHGFDEYFGLPYSNDMWPSHPEAKRGTYPPLPLIEGDKVVDEEVTPDEQANLTTWYTERAVKFIEHNKDRPFFFYLAHSMPHVPLFVSDKFKGKSSQGLYGDVIMEIDWSVGEVLKALKQHKLEDNTLVIFTSDNGPWLSYGNHAGSAQPLREGKGTCWEGGTRVPCIMRWPGKIPKGKSSDAMLMTMDLFPTIAKLVGAELPQPKIDGLDVWSLIAGEKGAQNPHEAYFFYYETGQLQAVTSGDGRWKLHLPHTFRTLAGHPGGTNGTPAKYEHVKMDSPELYDLKNDIGEKQNVASENPEIVQRLLAFAEKAREELGDSLTSHKGSGVREPGRVKPLSLIEATVTLGGNGDSRLPANYIWATLQDREQDSEINAAFEQALTQDTRESKLALLRVLELKFIHDPKISGLDVLGSELSKHFREFAWQENDFPGGAEGTNEQFADVMVDTLDLVRPERRANSTRDAVVLRAEATEAVWDYITNQWVSVPDQERWKLNRHALESFVRMREQAKAEGVDLIISSGHRYPQVAQANAARAGNPNAVASFSSHSLGLAIDFKMSHREDFKVKETGTGSMPELVRMRESPVHKWLLLRGEEFGWYPYQNEPWHWEYNPPGFREIYWADFPGGAPEREIIMDEP